MFSFLPAGLICLVAGTPLLGILMILVIPLLFPF